MMMDVVDDGGSNDVVVGDLVEDKGRRVEEVEGSNEVPT